MKFRSTITVAFLFVSLAALARDSGEVKGTVTFNGKPTNLTNAWAWKGPSPFTKGQIDTIVLLADRPVDNATLANFDAMIAIAKQGKLTAMQVDFNPKGEIDEGTFFSPAVDGYFFATVMSGWRKRVLTPAMVEGTLVSVDEPRFINTPYAYSVTFKVPVGPAPKRSR